MFYHSVNTSTGKLVVPEIINSSLVGTDMIYNIHIHVKQIDYEINSNLNPGRIAGVPKIKAASSPLVVPVMFLLYKYKHRDKYNSVDHIRGKEDGIMATTVGTYLSSTLNQIFLNGQPNREDLTVCVVFFILSWIDAFIIVTYFELCSERTSCL